MDGILVEFWDNKEVVTIQRGYHGTQFRDTHGTTQWVLTSSTLFNVVVESVVRHFFLLSVEDV